MIRPMIGHYFFMVLPNRLWKVFEPPIEKPPRKGVDNPEDAPLTTGYCPTKSRSLLRDHRPER
jgi:hypothetical protein